jgi:alpha-L-fucosidase 2
MLRLLVSLSITATLATPPLLTAADDTAFSNLRLWYRQPAATWVEALPLGNGRLGAMVFGGIENERLQLNEDTVWGGGPYDPTHDEALPAFGQVRELIFAGEYLEAQRIAGERLMARPLRQMPYQTVGDLLLTFPGGDAATDYWRELDLDTAIARSSFAIGEHRYEREAFVSPVDQVVVMRLTASGPGLITFNASLQTPQRATIYSPGIDRVVMRGSGSAVQGVPGAIRFDTHLRVINDGGSIESEDGRLRVNRANSVVILISTATNFRRFNDLGADAATLARSRIDAAAAKSFDELRRDHIAEHRRLFRRVSLDLGSSAAARLPTDERIRESARQDDPQLAALAFQYGRYLLISSSRPGTQPATLQGIWNDSLTPPWESKYTININTEMNYWPAEITNLAECHEPLFDLIRDLSETGQRTARRHYGASGWVVHHNTDLWRATAPIDGPFWGTWPTGGAWLCQHLWEHYLYGLDREFLARAYPWMRGAAEFFLETLVEDPKTGWLVTNPSVSPENAHMQHVSLVAGPTMDMQLLRDLFANCARAAVLLNRDADFRARLLAARSRLAPNQIGQSGQLQEWQEDWDLRAPELNHRHVSHLYGLYPSDQIHRVDTPELAAAARRSLELRGDFATGWGIGWRINLWARLGEGERAHQVLYRLLQPDRSYPNMFDAHPPFQIDGNFGATAGIAEMLLQSRLLNPNLEAEAEIASPKFELDVLPALPPAWPAGRVTGLRMRGGFEVALSWRDHRVSEISIRSKAGSPLTLRHAGRVVQHETKPGGEYRFGADLQLRR